MATGLSVIDASFEFRLHLRLSVVKVDGSDLSYPLGHLQSIYQGGVEYHERLSSL